MKIYALRDRLIDYFMQPFVGPDDKNVLAAVARTINQGELTSDIAQAPHHFEVWSLATITEDGHIVEERYLVQDCAALVRGGLRNQPGQPGVPEAPGTEISRHRTFETIGGRTPTDPGALPGKAPAAPVQGTEGNKAAR